MCVCECTGSADLEAEPGRSISRMISELLGVGEEKVTDFVEDLVADLSNREFCAVSTANSGDERVRRSSSFRMFAASLCIRRALVFPRNREDNEDEDKD